MIVRQRPPEDLRALVADGWRRTRLFDIALTLGLYMRRETLLDGPCSNLYAICERDGSAWKIGLAGDPKARLATLQIGNPRELVLYAWVPAPQRLEAYFHTVLRRERLLGEWFAGRRTLTVVSMIESAQEQCWDIEEHFGSSDATDTMFILTDRVDMLFEAAA